MCIIVYKPENANMPSKKTLRHCWDNNSDGAGYMFAHNDKVIIKKGFMSFKSLYDSLRNDYTKFHDKSFVIHFRISTQGGVRRDLTHPFPLTENIDDMRLLRTTSDFGVAHNGIITLTSTSLYNTTITYNDTMKFISEYLSLIISKPKDLENEKTLKLIQKLADSKLAIMDNSGKVTLIGAFTQHKGCFFSNASYQAYKPITTTTKTYSSDLWDDYYDDWDYYGLTNYGQWTFTPDYCPDSIDKNSSYCENCVSRKFCKKGGSFDV